MSYDGSQFKALDEEAFKDQFDEDMPLDTWLEQRLRANTLYLASGYDSVSIPYLTSASDFTASTTDRYWCTRNKARHDFWAVEVTRGMTGFDISGLIACGTDGSGGTGVDIEARIVDWTGPTPNDHRILGTKTLTYADTSGAFEAGALAVTFNGGVWTGPPRLLFLEIWLQGDDAGAAGKTYEMTWRPPMAIESTVTIIPDNFIRGYLKDSETGTEHDVWGVSGDIVRTYPKVSNYTGKKDFIVRYMYWLQIRSLSIRPTYDAVVRADLPSPAELGAQLPVASITAMPQIQGAVGTANQVRHLAFGPVGERPATELTLPENWLWTLSPTNEVIMQGIAIDGYSTLEVVVVWAPFLPNVSDTNLEATTTVNIRGLSSGDTDWSGATVMASGSITTSHSVVEYEDSITLKNLEFREKEEAGTGQYQTARDSISFTHEHPNLMVTRVPLTLPSVTNSRWREPLEIEIEVNASYPDGVGTINEYIVAYTLIGRGA